RLFEPLRVRLGVVKFQRIAGREIFEKLAPAAAIDGYCQVLLDREPMMESALGADVEIALDFLAKGDFAASRAFYPNVFIGGGALRRLRTPRSLPLPLRHRSASGCGAHN